jgi:hypothetical protein
MTLGDPTLDQLRIFTGVADHASFGAAATALGRAVSAMSCGIAQRVRYPDWSAGMIGRNGRIMR